MPKRRNKSSGKERTKLLFSGLLVVVGVLQIVILCRQTEIIRLQKKATLAPLQASVIENAINANDGRETVVLFSYQNVGEETATNVTVKAWTGTILQSDSRDYDATLKAVRASPDSVRCEEQEPDSKRGQKVFRGGKGGAQIAFAPALASRVKSGSYLLVAGCIVYKAQSDIVRLPFCRILAPENEALTKWVNVICPAHN